MTEQLKQQAVERFQQMIRKRTVSVKGGGFDKKEFEDFYSLLRESYPTVFSTVEAHRINEFGILLRWRGKDQRKDPVVLMAHHDVVSDENQQWEHPAFSGEIHEDCIWGRGTIDTKCLVGGVLEAFEKLMIEGFTPVRDIYFASSNCEEVGGDTMPKIVEWFRENNIKPYFVLDEGGAIMSKLPMGIKTPFAMVALSEKGWAKVRLTASAKTSTHSVNSGKADKLSAPMKIVHALSALESSPMPAVMTPALEEMLRSFADYVDAPLKQVFRNISLFRAAVKKVMETNPDTAAMIRSAINVTRLEAGNEKGTLPDSASAMLSIKIAPHDSLEAIMEHIKKTVGEQVTAELIESSPAPRISEFRTDSFELIKETVKKVFPDVGVSPFILNAGTDSRHFAPICSSVYRFGAFRLDDELFGTVHGANERIPVKDYLKCIEFYEELIKRII